MVRGVITAFPMLAISVGYTIAVLVPSACPDIAQVLRLMYAVQPSGRRKHA